MSQKSHYKKGSSYLNLQLVPVYINDDKKITDHYIGLQAYNSKQWFSHPDKESSNKYFPVEIKFSSDNKDEDFTILYYKNYQLITDLFDIILLEGSDYMNKEIYPSYGHMIRDREYILQLSKNINRYTTKLIMSRETDLVLIANPKSSEFKSLASKRKKLNEQLHK